MGFQLKAWHLGLLPAHISPVLPVTVVNVVIIAFLLSSRMWQCSTNSGSISPSYIIILPPRWEFACLMPHKYYLIISAFPVDKCFTWLTLTYDSNGPRKLKIDETLEILKLPSYLLQRWSISVSEWLIPSKKQNVNTYFICVKYIFIHIYSNS